MAKIYSIRKSPNSWNEIAANIELNEYFVVFWFFYPFAIHIVHVNVFICPTLLSRSIWTFEMPKLFLLTEMLKIEAKKMNFSRRFWNEINVRIFY